MDDKCLYIAISIFSLYVRKVPFTHFDKFLAAAISHYIAAKVAYKKPKINDYELYVHLKAPIDGELGGTREDFDKVKDQVHKVAVELELNILAV